MLSTCRERLRDADRMPRCGFNCWKIADDVRPKTRPINLSPGTAIPTPELFATVNVRRRLFAIASPHPSTGKYCIDLLRPPPKARYRVGDEGGLEYLNTKRGA